MNELRPEQGGHPHWLSYVLVDDLDATLERIEQAGGRALAPPTEIPEAGRFAVVADPQGAVVSPYQPAHEWSGDDADASAPGGFCWHELLARDVDGAVSFYQQAFGWTTAGMDMGEGRMYYLFKVGEADAGGMLPMPGGLGAPPSWLVYFAVGETDAAVAKAGSLGASVHVPPTEIPSAGRFAVLSDPAGAAFALLGPNAG